MKPCKNLSAGLRVVLSGVLAVALVAWNLGGCDLFNLASGSNNQNPPAAKAVQPVFTSPSSNISVPVGQVVTVSWFASSDTNTVTSQLYYDKDGLRNTGDEVPLAPVSKVAKDYTAATYSWDTTGLPLGAYHLLVVASDGTNPAVTIYCSFTVTIVSSTPKITVTEPSVPLSVTPAMNVVIKWTQHAPLGTSHVTLYYDNDVDYTNGNKGKITPTPMEELADSTGDKFVWNVPAIPAGQYYILAELDYGTGKVFGYSTAPVAVNGPAIQIINPSQNVIWHGGGSLAIRYEISGARSNSNVQLFYEDSQGNRTMIGAQPVINDQIQSFTWQSGPLTSGSYRIGLSVDDGVNDPADLTVYAPGSIVDSGPTLSLTSPAVGVPAGIGGTVTVNFNYESDSAPAKVELFYDTNKTYDPATDQAHVFAILQEPAGTGSGTAVWTVPSLAVGTYTIGAVMTVGTNTMTAYAAGSVILTGGRQVSLTDPAQNVNAMTGDVVSLKWTTTNVLAPPADVVRLFYNVIPSATGSTPIANNLDPTTGLYSWTLPKEVVGTVYVGAILTDNGTDGPASFAPGSITVPSGSASFRDLHDMTSFSDTSPNNPMMPILVFQGFSAGGGLGAVLAGGPFYISGQQRQSDLNGDGIPDFVLVAPTGKPLILQSQTARYGEAYLVCGWQGVRRAGQKVLVSAITDLLNPPTWPGAMFPGYQYANSSLGIASVAILPDLDQDNKQDLLFGLPYVDGVAHEDQDYDPIDQDNWHRPPVPQPPPADPDTYANLTAIEPKTPNGNQPDFYTGNSGGTPFKTGLVTFVASSISTTGFNNLVLPLDDIGQASSNPLPRSIRGNGMRVYPETLFRDHGNNDLNDQTHFGQSVAAGDLDADGLPDWLISAPGDKGGNGTIEIIFSTTYQGGFNPGKFPTIYTGAKLNALSYPYVRQDPDTGTPLDRQWGIPWVRQFITGENAEGLDKPVIVGDFNGDDRDDLACVGPNYNIDDGAAYIIFGSPAFGSFDVTNIQNNATSLAGLRIKGEVQDPNDATKTISSHAHLGASHARLGDMNGDGYDDWIIGAPNYTYKPDPNDATKDRTNCGAVVIVFGHPDVNGPHTLADIGDMTTGKTVPGLIIVGATGRNAADPVNHPGDQLGTYVTSAGDVDGDGYPDILISSPGYTYKPDPNDATKDRAKCGAIYLIYGGPRLKPSNNVLDLALIGQGISGKVYVGPNANDGVGPISPIGDIDGDGRDDFLIGNPKANPRGVAGAGEAYLLYGSARTAQ